MKKFIGDHVETALYDMRNHINPEFPFGEKLIKS